MMVDNQAAGADLPPDEHRGTASGWKRILASGVIAVLITAACGGSSDSSGRRQELLVSAAASLTLAFQQMEAGFERAYPETDVVLNLAGSSLLREQILSGAPIGVFASANPAIMAQVAEAGHLEGPYEVFALNHMTLAVPEGNPGGVTGLHDLAQDELLVGLCIATVPCGDFAHRVLAHAGVQPVVDTEEPNVRALLTKVEASELDVAVVYVTDTVASGGVDAIPIPDDLNVLAEYPIAVVSGSPHPTIAGDFVAFVLSAEGRGIMERHGFSLP